MKVSSCVQGIICVAFIAIVPIACSSGPSQKSLTSVKTLQAFTNDHQVENLIAELSKSRLPTPTAAFPKSLGQPPASFLNIIHLNDVYNIRESPRCLAKIDAMRDKNTLAFFSGDFMGPSFVSRTAFGYQMFPVLAAFNFTFSVIGNHEFDYSEDRFHQIDGLVKGGWSGPTKNPVMKSTQANANPSDLAWKFKPSKEYKTENTWLLSNFWRKGVTLDTEKTHEKVPGGAQRWGSRTLEDGTKVCTMGLVDHAWMTGTKLEPNPQDYHLADHIDTARKLSKYLREKEKCDLIFAISHMENKSDEEVIGDKGDPANNIPPNDIDFVFGGHDHVYYVRQIGERVLLKSGQDFTQFSNVKMWWSKEKLKNPIAHNKPDGFSYICKADDVPQNLEFLFSLHRPDRKGDLKYLNVLVTQINIEKADDPHKDLQGFFDTDILPLLVHELTPVFEIKEYLYTDEAMLLSGETSLLNLLADVGRAYHGGDIGIVNVRMLKTTKTFRPGALLRHLDFMELFPYSSDKYVEIIMTGAELLGVLEEALKLVGQHSKRWIGVSGVSFRYDMTGSDEPTAVLRKESVMVNAQKLELDKPYRAVVLDEMVNNKKVGFAPILGKQILTLKQNWILPVDVFQYMSKIFQDQPDAVKAEFTSFKKGSCRAWTLDQASPIQSDSPNPTASKKPTFFSDSFDQKDGSSSKKDPQSGEKVRGNPEECQKLMKGSSPDVLRRLRFYSMAGGHLEADERTILSIKLFPAGRMKDPIDKDRKTGEPGKALQMLV